MGADAGCAAAMGRIAEAGAPGDWGMSPAEVVGRMLSGSDGALRQRLAQGGPA